MKPFNQKVRGLENRNVFFLGNEVQHVPATTPAETVPAILADTDPEGGFVFASVNRARARKTIATLAQLGHEIVVLQNLNNGNRVFYNGEIDKLGMRHGDAFF